MEHSTAIMEDAGKAIDGASSSKVKHEPNDTYDDERKQNNFNRRKRKGDFPDSSLRHGSRGGRQGGRSNNKRHKKGDMGRGEYFRDNPDKREKTNASRQKRQAGNGPNYGAQFSQAEIDAEERRPKRKVAVMIGYSGTGYKGMQISASEKTIEGDLFNAFVAAGAISKANADDPKKASLVRCARTDKGVHAAGNMISLKLIVEEEDIVAKINANLSPQIRVWGIERTIGSFSCYQACDSRWYEYLIPSHAFLPPHPSSWLAKKLEEHADEAGDRVAYENRQEDVRGFWEQVDELDIKSVVETIDEDIRIDVIRALQGEDEANARAVKSEADVEQPVKVGKSVVKAEPDVEVKEEDRAEEATIILGDPVASNGHVVKEEASIEKQDGPEDQPIKAGRSLSGIDQKTDPNSEKTEEAAIILNEPTTDDRPPAPQLTPEDADRQLRLRAATKQLRNAYTSAKRRYRIPASRIERIQAALTKFVGTANYHNYTVQKTFRDPSAKRHIKSFVVNTKPILIGDGRDDEKSEWLSLKVHGQSFMMHQIRKMIGMVALLVRCGSDLTTLDDSLTSFRYSIPKVPGLGLLLERPAFDSYNNLQAPKHDREKLDFSKYETELEDFKQREIYQRIFREEEEKSEFSKFFNHIDNFKEPYFLYVTSKGLEATKGIERKPRLAEVEGSDGGEDFGDS